MVLPPQLPGQFYVYTADYFNFFTEVIGDDCGMTPQEHNDYVKLFVVLEEDHYHHLLLPFDKSPRI